jgi:hypothetical protein
LVFHPTDDQPWSTLPSQKSLYQTRSLSQSSRSNRRAAPFLLPGGLFGRKQPNPLIFSPSTATVSRNKPSIPSSPLIDEEKVEASSTLPIKITLFQPSRNSKIPQIEQKSSEKYKPEVQRVNISKVIRPDGGDSSEDTHIQHSSGYFDVHSPSTDHPRYPSPEALDLGWHEPNTGFPTTTSISHILLEAPYADPLAPPKRFTITIAELQEHVLGVRHQYAMSTKDELEHMPTICTSTWADTGIKAAFFVSSPLEKQLTQALMVCSERLDL